MSTSVPRPQFVTHFEFPALSGYGPRIVRIRIVSKDGGPPHLDVRWFENVAEKDRDTRKGGWGIGFAFNALQLTRLEAVIKEAKPLMELIAAGEHTVLTSPEKDKPA